MKVIRTQINETQILENKNNRWFSILTFGKHVGMDENTYYTNPSACRISKEEYFERLNNISPEFKVIHS